jgi:hypothetical protein
MTTLQEVRDAVAKDVFGMTPEEAIKKGICIDCRQDALANCYSDVGRREYQISGLCETCFDSICGGG